MPLNRISTFFEKRTRVAMITVGAAIALAAGGLASYWVVTQRRPAIASLPVGSDLVPQDALMTVSFSTDTEQWRELRQFGTPETQEQLDERLAEWRDRLLTDYGYRYDRDVQPWIGEEATLAVLTNLSEAPETPDPIEQNAQTLVLILPIDDVVQAQAVLSEAQDSAERSWTVRDYNGAQIRETEVDGRNLSVTVVDNRFLVISEDGAAIERMIDTHRGGESVADTPGYRQAIADVAATDPFLRVYVNAPVAREVVTTNTIQPIPTQGFSPLKNNQGIAATVTLEEDTIQIQGAGWLPQDSEQRYQVNNTATNMPTLLPEETLMMMSGANLQQFWQQFSQGPVADPKSLSNPAILRDAIQSTTGLDLDQDLLAWMDGEFSLALIADPAPSSTVRTAGVVFMVKASDRTQADAALKRLDDVMGDRYQFEVKETNLKGESVVQWVSPFASLTVTRGWMSSDVAFLAIGAPVAETILPKPNTSLSQNSLFQSVTQSDRNTSSGYFFLNLEQLLGTSGSLPIPNLPENGEAYAKAIRAIGVKAAIQRETSTRFDISVLMRKTENARPLPSPEE
ncbi:DUF3352 domain-containing protein [Oscillatoria sp. FACHB-1407]|uniref:DUF3352 domain-containing protein n=1 Tax=Oscillatoria sp. FACHB-1407 TaxID=2692847 RepID=UPI0016891D91|nr:DUF3352 domain-containing protein [Oscillatoria sp. FACHB-1407]MBD2461793.1 DUF3352 domain-containing protein [Oscillatoria sp. FACHB-1407]